jgi:hypothetical protein
VLPLRRQYEPDDVHPHGHVPLGGFGTASCAPCDGTQYDPLDVYPCGQLPPGPGGFGTGNGSACAAVADNDSTMARMALICATALARPS